MLGELLHAHNDWKLSRRVSGCGIQRLSGSLQYHEVKIIHLEPAPVCAPTSTDKRTTQQPLIQLTRQPLIPVKPVATKLLPTHIATLYSLLPTHTHTPAASNSCKSPSSCTTRHRPEGAQPHGAQPPSSMWLPWRLPMKESLITDESSPRLVIVIHLLQAPLVLWCWLERRPNAQALALCCLSYPRCLVCCSLCGHTQIHTYTCKHNHCATSQG